jgi:hypothetical protein
MHIREFGADIEALEWRPHEIGANPAFLEVRYADRAAKPSQRIARIMHFHIGAVDSRGQGREPIMLVSAGDVPAPLLLAGDAAGKAVGRAAGENAIRTGLRVPAGAVIRRREGGTGIAVLIDRAIIEAKIVACDITKGAFFISGLERMCGRSLTSALFCGIWICRVNARSRGRGDSRSRSRISSQKRPTVIYRRLTTLSAAGSARVSERAAASQ